MDRDILRIGFLVLITGVAGVFATGIWAVVRVVSLKTRDRLAGRDSLHRAADDDRMARLEQAIDSIAVEVERISEAQRFTAKVMAERLPERVPDR